MKKYKDLADTVLWVSCIVVVLWVFSNLGNLLDGIGN